MKTNILATTSVATLLAITGAADDDTCIVDDIVRSGALHTVRHERLSSRATYESSCHMRHVLRPARAAHVNRSFAR